MLWDPTQYLKLADHRLRPAIDLLNRVNLDDPATVYDLGAGTGNVTELLANRWPNARIIGVDSSEEMLKEAAQKASNIEWEVGDIGTWQPSPAAELIFSNAALHWEPNHTKLFVTLMASVKPGGVLAVQMPRPGRTMARQTRTSPKTRPRRSTVVLHLNPGATCRNLRRLGNRIPANPNRRKSGQRMDKRNLAPPPAKRTRRAPSHPVRRNLRRASRQSLPKTKKRHNNLPIQKNVHGRNAKAGDRPHFSPPAETPSAVKCRGVWMGALCVMRPPSS